MNIPNEVDKLFKIACKSDSTVLIVGNTGTGKTSLARKIHDNSHRRGRPFVVVNLATLHEGTLESELFGHEKGSFTGAGQRKMGRLEFGQGGTVFLDEVGELPPRLQARLLEFLQSHTISRVGGSSDIRLDVRVIAATHKNLEQSVQKGEFREDLFHRLRVILVPLKSLQERPDEFDELVHSCLQEICLKIGRSILRISSAVAEVFESYPWPGNIRELRNVLEYAVLASNGPEISLSDLPAWLNYNLQNPNLETISKFHGLGMAELPLTLDFQETLERFEKEYFRRALSRNGGRINRTARQVGISKTTLIRKIRAYGLPTS